MSKLLKNHFLEDRNRTNHSLELGKSLIFFSIVLFYIASPNKTLFASAFMVFLFFCSAYCFTGFLYIRKSTINEDNKST